MLLCLFAFGSFPYTAPLFGKKRVVQQVQYAGVASADDVISQELVASQRPRARVFRLPLQAIFLWCHVIVSVGGMNDD